ncbi:MAG: hypothetical protein WCX86_07790 [Candidatus Hydrogenedentales bacterium]
MQDAGIAAPPPPPAMHAIDLRQRLWGTTDALADLCEMKFRARSGAQPKPWESARLWSGIWRSCALRAEMFGQDGRDGPDGRD